MADAGSLIAARRGVKRRMNGRVWFGTVTIGALVFVALFAPWLAPHDPLQQDLLNFLLPPFWVAGADPAFPLGTDGLGRDILSRLIFGARTALTVAVIAATLAAALGTTLGLLAGFFGGWVDSLISRLVDIWMAFPPVLLSIVLVAVIGAGLPAVIIAIAIVDWTRFCRVIRAEVLVQRELDYVRSAVTIGLAPWRILSGEVLINVAPVILVLLTMEMGIAVIVEAILSFVGLSVASDFPTWGGLIEASRQYIYQAWWMMALPVACITLVVLGFNALGDGLRTAFDPVVNK